ncbi:protein-L-isoaspartate O-methyltransferase [Erythrobacter sp.]|uniref:protein-L-isoaspartate O-methyltransferase family protein n=1 Tax=Erythrobacter sp. TaxID=1042 RepID=UPI001425FE0E|nr:protein-L-isoaspartate O-methyltransferase [Erythrobacter sp.]QIQ87458.1 MAG: protein-L-isoaspartate O-methyltransferase [Erythrobacter sp.]
MSNTETLDSNEAEANAMKRSDTGPDTREARRAMIKSQLRTSGVNDETTLERMRDVPREEFLPPEKAPLAYIDRSIALPGGGAMAAPLFYGKLLVEAAARKDDRVLVVENGTGYLAELLRPLVGSLEVTGTDEAANGNVPGDGDFTLVVIDGAIEQLPESLAARVAEGGRVAGGLVLRGVTRLASGKKIAGRVAFMPVEDLGIPVIPAFAKPKGWSFP